jgi:hypothetical protein
MGCDPSNLPMAIEGFQQPYIRKELVVLAFALVLYRLRCLLVRHVHGVCCHLTKALGMHLHATHRFADVLANKKSILDGHSIIVRQSNASNQQMNENCSFEDPGTTYVNI